MRPFVSVRLSALLIALSVGLLSVPRPAQGQTPAVKKKKVLGGKKKPSPKPEEEPSSEDARKAEDDAAAAALKEAQEESDRRAAAEAAAAAASTASETPPSRAAPAEHAQPRAAASTSSNRQADPDALPEQSAPELAPFTGPASNRPLPPPAPLGDEEPSSLEATLQALPMVTSALKREQRLSEVPMTVSWIPAEELEGTGQFTLCDAIQYFPGLECRHGPMRKAAVSARGLGSNFLSNRLLLLKDGRPETDPWTGIFYPDETTPLINVKQIEVIRGPGSSLYGSNAFSGVINIIQRDPEDVIAPKNNVGMDVRLLGGQYNTARLQATVAGKAGPVSGMVNYYGFRSDGPQLFNNPEVGRVDTNEWSVVHQVSGKVVAGPLKLDAAYTTARLGRPGGQAITTVGNCGRCHYTPNDLEAVENFTANAQVDVKVTDFLRVFGEAYGYFKRREVELQNQITTNLQPALGKRRRLGGEARALLTFGGLNVTIGGDAKLDEVNNQNILPGLNPVETVNGKQQQRIDTRQAIFGAFVDAEYRITSSLIIGAGLRYDLTQIPEIVWTTPSAQLSPRASIVFHALPQLTLRTNYGRAFRSPTLAELAINQQMYASTLLGNPALRAETLDTVEAAVDLWPAQGKVRLTGKGIYMLASNFINEELILGSTSQFRNIGNARIFGAEAEAAAQVKAINSSFDLAYQFLNAKNLGYAGGTSQLDYAPSHRIHFRGRSEFGRFFADFYALFVSTRQDPALVQAADGTVAHVQLPSYLVASARVGANIIDGLSLSIFANNLFNTQYDETFGFPQPGISVFSEVKFVY